MTFSQVIKWFSLKSDKEKIKFLELFLSEIIVMNRCFWSDPDTSSVEKIESLKWSNELTHRIWGLLFGLKRGDNNEIEDRLIGHINFYTKLSKELRSNLPSIIVLSVERFKRIEDKKNKSER